MSRSVQTRRHPPRQRSRCRRRRSVATFENARALGQQAGHAVQELGLQQHLQVAVADGAHWIKKKAATHFPHSEQILDWPTCGKRCAKPPTPWKC
ncbi:hypothetical protein [Ktedonospora formicarum]|uniref:hypothetical protein n=1 Tax=Ktedonospora formicarum TaxID=2778364 RepID=UPI001C68AD61|nr:hypothetical protein [Ktedonospora formicarum]